jgi:PAS domain S-box-containing protein
MQQRQVKELDRQAAISKLGQRALAEVDLSTLMDEAAALVARILEVEYSQVLERQPDGQTLRLRAGVGWQEGLVGQATVSAGLDSEAGYSLLSAKPVVISELRTETRFHISPLLQQHHVVSGMSVAIQGVRHPFGVLGAYTTKRRSFTQAEIHFLQAVADLLANAIALHQAKAAQARLAAILEATPDFVSTTDPEGRVLYINRGGRKIIGLGEEEELGQLSICDFHPEWASRRIVEEVLPAVLRDGVWSGETVLRRRDGSEIAVSQLVIAHRQANGEVESYSTIIRDLSEKERFEAQLRQAQRMEAIGTLAGGIAHDFNNLLTAIVGNIQLAKRRARSVEATLEYLEEVETAAQRAASLTQQLLAFSRRQHLSRCSLNLNELLSRLIKMLRPILGENLEISLKLEPDLALVFADPTQIEQVIMNLALNARDATADVGQLTFETHNVTLDEAFCRDHPWAKPGRYVQVVVSDTGCGMDAETQQRIFEPFFTTKEVGKGTGLGLAVVYGIVKQHDGLIHLYSELGRGTSFRIYLPVTEEKQRQLRTRKRPKLRGGTETILIAEDEEALRRLTHRMLTELGYEVLSAQDGQQALELYAAHRERISLVILDLVMPKLSGYSVYEQLREMDSRLPVIFMTGYGTQSPLSQRVLESGAILLQKPYTLEMLSAQLREALDGELDSGLADGTR